MGNTRKSCLFLGKKPWKARNDPHESRQYYGFDKQAALGLGTCWVGSFDEAAVSAAIDLGENERPVIMIPVGYPDENPDRTDRKPLDQVTKFID